MKKSSKKLIASVIACTLVGTLAFNGTLAYLTDTEGTTNVVTVGKVQIDLEEPGYPGNNSDEVKRVIPNQEIVKDPQVENTGNNAALIYLKVDIPQENFTEMGLDGTLGEKKMQDLFALKGLDVDWELIQTTTSTNADTQKTKTTYVYAYRKPLEKGATTSKLFNKVQMKNAIENDLSGNVEDIVITACAIQATDIPGENLTVGDDGYLSTATLNSVHTIFVNQSGDKVVRPANDGDRTQTGKLGTITYNLGDGASLNDALYEYNTADYGYVPPTPVRNGYIFTGWTPASIPADSTGNVTFTANWKVASATFDNDTLKERIRKSLTSVVRVNDPSADVIVADNLVSTSDSETPVYAWYTDAGTTLNWYSEAKNPMLGTDCSWMFGYCDDLTDISGLSSWNTGNVTDMSDMFKSCYRLTDISALSSWDTKNVTDMSSMFETDAPDTDLADVSVLSNWNTENVTNMNGMFSGCSKLTDISALSNWNTGNVTDMSYMFCTCSGLADISALSAWNTGNVTNMDTMFSGCMGLTNISGLSSWDTKNVTNMRLIFGGCLGLTDASGINDWDINNVTNFDRMFVNSPSHPEFTKRAGTWNFEGTFRPTA